MIFTLDTFYSIMNLPVIKMYDFFMHRFMGIYFDYTYHSHSPSNTCTYVCWGKNKMGCLWREGSAFFS